LIEKQFERTLFDRTTYPGFDLIFLHNLTEEEIYISLINITSSLTAYFFCKKIEEQGYEKPDLSIGFVPFHIFCSELFFFG
jgi:hypothetical protein